MRHHTTLPALLLPLAALLSAPAPALSLPNVTVATVPAAPAPGDPIVLKLSGQWPDACVPTSARTSFTRAGAKLQVLFDYSGFSGACATVVSPWAIDVPVGSLAEGTYTVEVFRSRTLMSPELIGSGSFTVAALPETTVWLPGFSAPGEAITISSSLTAYNNSDGPAKVKYVGAWDALGERTPPASVDLAPGTSGILDSHSLRAGQAVQMLALAAPGRVAYRATLERLETVPEGLPKVPESLGRLELPIFTELFPAGVTAVAGDVSLSASECAGSGDARRRVNLTLFNAGTQPARFVVSASSTSGGSGANVEYQVPARSLVQFNKLALDSLPVCQAGGAWFRITGDQPFLAYVSTVRPESFPGVLPYEIFPARIAR